ncbi:acyl-CoA dehydrogenase family protein [Aquabacterium sp. UBA2148]|uniref:acyl-CoA dehydrogenase family protein n=1 Tax=Aquabacterium sp. UBA2148 TaxID=1946042 RepID=UPI00257EAA44|nr:acyl-CoA dehydrogenase family protein [Aquabacterium sp. UBA2148]
MSQLVRIGLRALRKIAASPQLEASGLRGPTQRLIYEGTRLGFQSITTATRGFKAVQRLSGASRPARRAATDLFDLNPSEDQTMMMDAMRAFADEQLRPQAQQADAEGGVSPQLLQAFAELGVAALSVPDELGGAGDTHEVLTQALIAEQLAHGDLGMAWACLAPAAVSQALLRWGSASQQATYLGAFAGEHPPPAALALMEPTPLFDPMSLRTRAEPTPDGGYVLTGEKCMVPGVARAELFVIAADVPGHGPQLFVVEANTPGLSHAPEPTMGLRSAAPGRLRLDQVKLSAEARLGADQPDAYRECIQLGRLAWCALSVGCAQAVLDLLVPYVNERQAFGEPISHRQSVAFAVSNVAIELQGMRLLTWRAAELADRHDAPDGLAAFADAVTLARRLCADKGMQIGSDGVQLLGGHGFVKEYPVERWYRDLRAVALMEGGLLL